MIYKGEEALVKDLKSNKPFPVYFIYGQETYLKELYTKKIVNKVISGGLNEFNLNRFEGKKLSLDELSDSIEALPLMAEYRCVIVEDLDIEKMAQAEHKKLCELLSNPPETTVLIILEREITINEKKSSKSKKILEIIDKSGAVVLLNTRETAQIVKFIKSKCEKSNCSMSTDNANYIIDRCSTDMGLLSNELDKLCAYVKEGEISKEHIDKVTIFAIDAGVYDLSKSMLKGDYQKSIEILSDLLYLKEQPVSILSTLAYAFMDLYRARLARNDGKTIDDLLGAFDYNRKEFRIKNAYRDCGKYSLEVLQKIIELIIDTDYKLKSSKAEDKILMEQLITQIFIELQKEGRF